MALTYILYSRQLDRYYIGHTQQTVEERLEKHLRSHSGFTAKQILWRRAAQTKEEAYAWERKIRVWKSRAAIEDLIKGA